jgi:SAM-dependent methyltransferase
LELGCGNGDLLAALDPEHGVGVDFSAKMICAARDRHPQLRFIQDNVDELELSETFDAIILSDLINDLWDVQRVLERCRAWCHPRTRVILNSYSRVWQPVLATARSLRLAVPLCPQNWITPDDLENLLYLSGFERLRRWTEVLWPVYTPFLSRFANRYLVKLWPFRLAGLTNFFVARPFPKLQPPDPQPTVSVVVPARNEAGNIQNILQRTPEMGAGVEIIFVEGGSTDNTYETIEKTVDEFSHRRVRLFQQQGEGKGDAVRLGFAKATGDILMILDADLTVAPEDLPLFYQALTVGRGELINGVRLVYPTEQQAMRFLNLVGNKFFSLAFSFLLGQNIKDTLCGTKALWREDYDRIANYRSYFGDFDPFGDFDLLFGGARMNLKIVDMPIRYGKRSYGDTNISRWKHGFLLLRMMCFAARRIKFI